MTRLQIRLQQGDTTGGLENAGIAKIRHLTHEDGSLVKEWWQAEKPVGAAGYATQEAGFGFSSFDLPGGGSYEVTVTLPRGQDIVREYVLESGEDRQDTIPLVDALHESQGWQQFAGAPPFRFPKGWERETPPDVWSARDGEGPGLRSAAARRMKFLLNRAAREAPQVHAALSMHPTWHAMEWEDLEHIIRKKEGHLLKDWPLPWEARNNREFAAWFPQMPDQWEGERLVDDLRSKSHFIRGEFPQWVLFDSGGRFNLASIPWAWWGAAGPGHGETIRIDYDHLQPGFSQEDRPGKVSISIQDTRWSGLLGFLGSGRLNQAEMLADEVLKHDGPEEALYDKIRRPLVAVAGGIILIARARSLECQRWDDWLENLAQWFPIIPDGSIILGCRRAAQAKGRPCLEDAFGKIREGLQRGIPYFSASIRMANLTLARIGEELPQAEKLRKELALVSSRVDPGQVFTVIRF